jgi:hypothetical protein
VTDETDDAPKLVALRVVRGGQASDEEIAAIVAVVSTQGAAPPPRQLRRPLSPWVASGLVKGTRTKA